MDSINKQQQPVRICVDWGNTITRDAYLYEKIARGSLNKTSTWNGPESWNNIRSIGTVNKFDKVQPHFFRMADIYPGAIDFVSAFCGNEGVGSKTESYIVYDNKPTIDMNSDKIIMLMAMTVQENGGDVNGYYLGPDKLSICKQNMISIHVDDDPKTATWLAASGIKSILMLRKWNRLFDIDRLEIHN